MRAQTWIGIVVAAGIAGGAVWWLAGSGASAPSGEEAAGVEGSEPAGAAPAARLGVATSSRVEKAPPPMGRGAVVGTVRRDGRPVAAKVAAHFASPTEDGAGGSGYALRALRAPETPKTAPRTATAGADGTYAIGGAAAGTVSVVATTDDGAVGLATETALVDGARTQIDVDVTARGESLRGRVVHADGRPWTGRLTVGEQPIDEIRAVQGAAPFATDAEGKFTVTGLAAGAVSVSAFEPDVFAVRGPTVQVPYAGDYVVTVDGDGFDVKGRVLRDEDGAAVAGARVVCSGRGAGGATVGATTGEDGRFAMRAFGAKVMLYAQAAEYAEGGVDEVPHTGADLEVRLKRTARLSGRVATEDGKAVAGAAVLCLPVAQTTQSWHDPGSTRTDRSDAEGRYAFEALQIGDTAVFVRGGGWVSVELSGKAQGDAAAPVVKIAAGKDVVADLVVVRAPRIVGVVLDAKGAPAAGAKVEASPHTADRMALLFGRPPTGAARYAGDVPATATDPDGTFALDGVLPGVEYDLEAVAPGSAAGKASAVAVGATGDTRVEIRLPSPRWVDVTVIDAETGAPIAGAKVSVTVKAQRDASVVTDGFEMPDFDFSLDSGAREVTTDSAGRARAGPVAPGRLEATATAPDHVSPEEQQPVEGSEARDDGLAVTIRLERGYAIAGRVLMPDGTPAAEASLTAAVEGERHGSWRQWASDAAGSFRLEGLKRERYAVTATVSGERQYVATATADAGTTDLVLRLAEKAAGPRIVVRVLDPAGEPVASASAQFDVHFGHATSTSSAQVKDGRVVFAHEMGADATVAVVVTDAKGKDGARLPFGPARLEGLHAGGEYDLRMAPEKTIEGRVVGPDGKGVRDASVSAVPARAGLDDDSFYEFRFFNEGGVTTDADGAFRVGGLGDGDVVLRVSPPPAFVKPPIVHAQAGARGVQVTLRAGAAPTVTVLDAQGAPLAGARVTTTKEEKGTEKGEFFFAGYVSAMNAPSTGVDGRVRLANLDPAETYVLRVGPPASRTDLASSRLRRWAPGDVSVRLEKGFTVAGFVRDSAGSPVVDAQVTCTPKAEDAEIYRAKAGPDGAFRFPGLRAGAVELTATVGRNAREGMPSAMVTVSAPAEGVVLTIDRGLSLSLRIEGWKAYSEEYARATLWDDQKYLSTEFVGAGGVVTFRGLLEGKAYTLSVSPDAAGRMVYMPGVRAGGEVVAKLQVGKTITGHVVVPKGAECSVYVNERGLSLNTDVKSDGTFTFVGVPDGTWKVHASATAGKDSYGGDAEATAGGTVEIELKAGK